jgi:phosphoribosylaminoimidazolecarboxamide formyltransferase/IMP cyclohydrolase
LITDQDGATTLADKNWQQKLFMFHHYDTSIFNYFNTDETIFKASIADGKILRYGENPHQKFFFGDFDAMFNKLHGKESYNNLLDVDAAVTLISEFKTDDPTFAILKHNNACGLATRKTISDAYNVALACD